MAAVGHVLEAAPAVGDLLVLGERVGDQGEEADVVLEHLGQRLGRRTALAPVRVHEEMQRRLERGRLRLAVDLEAQRRHGLAEQPAPGPAPRHRFLAEQALEPLLELIGLLLAQVVEPRLVDGQRRHLHRRGEIGLDDLVELQLEEHEVGGDGGQLLLHVAVELGLGRVGGVGGVQQAGVRAEPAHHVAQRLVGLDGLGQRRSVFAEGGELALVGLGNALGVRCRPVEITPELRRRGARIEVAQVPDRHGPEVRPRCRGLPYANICMRHQGLPLPAVLALSAFAPPAPNVRAARPMFKSTAGGATTAMGVTTLMREGSRRRICPGKVPTSLR